MQNWNQWQLSAGAVATPMPQPPVGYAAPGADPMAMMQAYMQYYSQPAPSGYTAEQWATAQQQNWAQWQQWQQQYQQWQAQYGEKYQETMKHMSTQNMNLTSQMPQLPIAQPPPPLPKEDSKPPLPPTSLNTYQFTNIPPPHQNNLPLFPAKQNVNSTMQSNVQSCPLNPPLPPNQPPLPPDNSNNSGKEHNINGKRGSSTVSESNSAKKLKIEDEELTEAEKTFDAQFKQWEEQFNKWKEQNANHPDKTQYKQYEAKWTSWREKLIERREQMRRKREQQKQAAAKSEVEKNKNIPGDDKIMNILSSTENQGLINNLLGIGKSLGLTGKQNTSVPPPPPPPPATTATVSSVQTSTMTSSSQGVSQSANQLSAANMMPSSLMASSPWTSQQWTSQYNTGANVSNFSNFPSAVPPPTFSGSQTQMPPPNFTQPPPNFSNVPNFSQPPPGFPADTRSNSNLRQPTTTNMQGNPSFDPNIGNSTEGSLPHGDRSSQIGPMNSFECNRQDGPPTDRFGRDNTNDQQSNQFRPNDAFGPRNENYKLNDERQPGTDQFRREDRNYQEHGNNQFNSQKTNYNNDRFPPGNDRFGPGNNRFGPTNDRFGPGNDRFGSDRPGLGNDRFGPGNNRFGNERFGPGVDRAGQINESVNDRFGSNSDRFGANNETFGSGGDRFNLDRFDTKDMGDRRDSFTNAPRGFNRNDQFRPPDKNASDKFAPDKFAPELKKLMEKRRAALDVFKPSFLDSDKNSSIGSLSESFKRITGDSPFMKSSGGNNFGSVGPPNFGLSGSSNYRMPGDFKPQGNIEYGPHCSVGIGRNNSFDLRDRGPIPFRGPNSSPQQVQDFTSTDSRPPVPNLSDVDTNKENNSKPPINITEQTEAIKSTSSEQVDNAQINTDNYPMQDNSIPLLNKPSNWNDSQFPEDNSLQKDSSIIKGNESLPVSYNSSSEQDSQNVITGTTEKEQSASNTDTNDINKKTEVLPFMGENDPKPEDLNMEPPPELPNLGPVSSDVNETNDPLRRTNEPFDEKESSTGENFDPSFGPRGMQFRSNVPFSGPRGPNDRFPMPEARGPNTFLPSGPSFPLAPRDGPLGPRGSIDGQFGPRGPNSGQFGPRGPNDGQFGPRGPSDGQFGPRGPNDGQFGPRGVNDRLFGPRGPNDGLIGPRGTSDGSFGPRGTNDGPFGPRGPNDGPFGPRGSNDGPFRPSSGPFGLKGPSDGPFGSRSPIDGPFGPRGSNDGPFRPSSGPFGLKGPSDGPFGSRSPIDGPFGPTGSNDGPFGPRGPSDVPFGPKGPMDNKFGPRGPIDNQFGPRGPNSAQFGPRGANSGQFGPRRMNEGQFGPPGSSDGQFGLQGPNNRQFGPGRSNDAPFDNRGPGDAQFGPRASNEGLAKFSGPSDRPFESRHNEGPYQGNLIGAKGANDGQFPNRYNERQFDAPADGNFGPQGSGDGYLGSRGPIGGPNSFAARGHSDRQFDTRGVDEFRTRGQAPENTEAGGTDLRGDSGAFDASDRMLLQKDQNMQQGSFDPNEMQNPGWRQPYPKKPFSDIDQRPGDFSYTEKPLLSQNETFSQVAGNNMEQRSPLNPVKCNTLDKRPEIGGSDTTVSSSGTDYAKYGGSNMFMKRSIDNRQSQGRCSTIKEFCIEKQFNYNHAGATVEKKCAEHIPAEVIDYAHTSRSTTKDHLTPVQCFDYGHGNLKPVVPEHEVYPKKDFRNWEENEQNLKEYTEKIRRYEHYAEHTDSKRPDDYNKRRTSEEFIDDKKFERERREKKDYKGKEREDRMFDRISDKDQVSRYDKNTNKEKTRERCEISQKEADKESNKDEDRSKGNINWQENSNKNVLETKPSDTSVTDTQHNVVDPPSKTLELAKTPNCTMVDDLLCSPGRQNRPPKIAIILRGPPGSGKSFIAKLIKDKEVEQGGSAPRILSLDDYFLVEKEIESTDDNGKKVTIKEMAYEYEEAMEQSYVTSLVKAFKKNITDGFFNFIILDCINEKISDYEEMWSFAKTKGFKVYVCEMEMDLQICLKRNVHNRTEDEINRIIDYFEPTPSYHQKLDVNSMLQEQAIEEVQMEDSEEPQEKSTQQNEDSQDSQDDIQDVIGVSKWERMETEDKLDRLDGLAKKKNEGRVQTMQDFLQVPDYYNMEDTSGKKRVRWADLEERKEQEKMRAVGFVVGHTNWDRMMDPTKGGSALTRTKSENEGTWELK